MKYDTLKALVNAKVYENTEQRITGGDMNTVLQSAIASLGAHYQMGGLVSPADQITVGDEPVVFLATTPGTYTYFGGIVVADGEVALLVWSGTAWSKQIPDIATRTEVSQLGQEVDVFELKSEVPKPFTWFSVNEGQYVTADASGNKQISSSANICYIEIPIEYVGHSIRLSGFTYTPSTGSSTTYTRVLFFDSDDKKVADITTATSGVMLLDKPANAASCFVDVPKAYKSEIIITMVSENSAANVENANDIQAAETKIDEISSLLMNNCLNGKGTTVVTKNIYGFSANRKCLLIFQNPAWGKTEITSSTSVVFRITNKVVGGSDEVLLNLVKQNTINQTYEFLIPAQSDYLEINARADDGENINFIIQDITYIIDLYGKLVIPTEECVAGSIQSNGERSGAQYVLTTPYIRVVGGDKIYCPEQKLTYDGEEYTIRMRVIGMQDTDKTGAHLLSQNTDLCPKTVTTLATDRYIRISFYFYHLVDGTWTIIDSSVEALTAFAGKFFFINNQNYGEFIYGEHPHIDSIIEDNEAIGDIIIPQFKKAIYNTTGVAQTDKPFVLLHFSDLHADADNLGRLLEYYNHYKSYIDDVLFTGDGVSNSFADDFTFWNSKGANKVLYTIGNHDTTDYSGGNYDWTANVGLNAYNKFIAPNVSEWGVTQPADAATNGLCYYYKDYSPNIRLVVIDDMALQQTGGDAAQTSWFESVLADAKTNSKCVIVAAHYPNSLDVIDCPFTGIRGHGWVNTYSQRRDLVNIVDNFITAGGKFVAWITGHLHRDMLGTVHDTTNKQLNVGISTASCAAGQSKFDAILRTANTKSADLFNMLKIDTYEKVLTLYRVGSDFDTYGRHIGTITIDYENGVLLEKY